MSCYSFNGSVPKLNTNFGSLLKKCCSQMWYKNDFYGVLFVANTAMPRIDVGLYWSKMETKASSMSVRDRGAKSEKENTTAPGLILRKK